MELDIKHLAAYLPYGIKIKYLGGLDDDNNRTDEASHLKIGDIGNLVAIDNQYTIGIYWIKTKKGTIGLSLKDISLILRPLSDLTKEIEVNGEKFVPIDIIYKIWYEKDLSAFSKRILNDKIRIYPESMPFWLVQKLLEWHFNVFNLPENLYVDINNL